MKIINKNKKATFDYEILETFKAGVILQGSEVKSIRQGQVNLKSSYVSFKDGRAYLKGANVPKYRYDTTEAYEPFRDRELLLNKRELDKIESRLNTQGVTLIPLTVGLEGRHIKVEIGLARGKKKHDKRASIKEREAGRQIARVIKKLHLKPMKFIPKSVQQAIEEFNKLPGIGSKSAERLVFYLLKKTPGELKGIGDSISTLKDGLQYCKTCQNLSLEDTCEICLNDQRNREVVCVVEDVLDLIALEKTNEFKGLYHVLHGIISPVDGVGPDELTIAELIERVKSGTIKELILALKPFHGRGGHSSLHHALPSAARN